jgi:hypothetical protein
LSLEQKGPVMKDKNYEELREQTRRLQTEGKLPVRPTDEQVADWAYGNAVIENDEVTLEMAKRAAANRKR